jgi:electron transport complex protein RnfC
MYELYNAIKYNKFTYETFITIAGPSLVKSMVLKVKVGTLMKDIINNKFKINNKGNNLFILDGLMTGSPCQIEKTMVTKNTIGLIVIPDEEIKENSCINCGMCYKICPVRVNPKKVMDTGVRSSNCINCGLCSYICPSHINLRAFLEGNHE